MIGGYPQKIRSQAEMEQGPPGQETQLYHHTDV